VPPRSAHRGIQSTMTLGTQVVWMLLLALPVASIAWTITHEEIFREMRERCVECSRQARSVLARKFFYLFTCEYCVSHWIGALVLLLTGFKLLLPDWRGYVLAFFTLPYVANFYMGFYAQAKLEAKKDRFGAKMIEHEAEIKAMEKDEKKQQAELAKGGQAQQLQEREPQTADRRKPAA
jgi:hypothetical protein